MLSQGSANAPIRNVAIYSTTSTGEDIDIEIIYRLKISNNLKALVGTTYKRKIV